ncbi:DUF4123 domain-containing protein [Pseudomonas indica]|uniref:DUF4123 domain-containing protein n=1 Tax=Pseudomonas indica TaxID=137658 RepID=UPI003FCF9800
MDVTRRQGYLFVDGLLIEPAMAWCFQYLPECQPPMPLLRGTAYDGMAELGPLLIPVRPGDQADHLWQQADGPLHSAVWLESRLDLFAMQTILLRRLQVRDPKGKPYWLRFYDAYALSRAHQAGLEFPRGFWHGIDAVWLPRDTGPILAWANPHPDDDAAPGDLGVAPQITLDWPLLQALANPETEIHA